MLNNKAVIIAVIETYRAYQHKRHIMKIWEYLGFNHRKAYRGYSDTLFGKHLCGRDELFNTLAFIDKSLYLEFYLKVPERYAMGDALSVAYTFLK